MRHTYPITLLFALLLLVGCQLDSVNQDAVPLILDPPTAQEIANLEKLRAVDPQQANLGNTFTQFNGGIPPESDIRTEWSVGDTEIFVTIESDENGYLPQEYEVVHTSDQLIVWVEVGDGGFPREDWIEEAKASLPGVIPTIENEIIPQTYQFFAAQPSAGIDENEAVHLVHTLSRGNFFGYVSPGDHFPRWADSGSNQRNVLYVNLTSDSIGGIEYYALITHELQHVLQVDLDYNEAIWMNEGLSMLISGELWPEQAGYPSAVRDYLELPDSSLTDFSKVHGDYGASWLMLAWLHEKYGVEFIRDLAREQKNGIAGIEATLEAHGISESFLDIYTDWIVAIYGSAHGLNLPADYAFESIQAELEKSQFIGLTIPNPNELRVGQKTETTVRQFGVDYWTIPADTAHTITLTPTQQINLFRSDPADGEWYWTTVPADLSQLHLTRQIDLSAVDTATLTFDANYQVSPVSNAFVSISLDGGLTWQTVATDAVVEPNPIMANWENNIQGISGSSLTPEWVTLTGDLSPWAGPGNNGVLLRFHYINSRQFKNDGFALDNMAIPEIGWEDGAESGEDGWEADGFVRHTNRFPQSYAIQTITIKSDNSAEVTQHFPNENGIYSIKTESGSDVEEIILAVAGTTPLTQELAGYHLILEPSAP